MSTGNPTKQQEIAKARDVSCFFFVLPYLYGSDNSIDARIHINEVDCHDICQKHKHICMQRFLAKKNDRKCMLMVLCFLYATNNTVFFLTIPLNIVIIRFALLYYEFTHTSNPNVAHFSLSLTVITWPMQKPVNNNPTERPACMQQCVPATTTTTYAWHHISVQQAVVHHITVNYIIQRHARRERAAGASAAAAQ